MSPHLDLTKEQAIETYKSMVSIGTESLKALQLINGGAIVAILAYLGRAGPPKAAQALGKPVGFFVAGLILATLAFLTTYFTQYFLFNDFFESEKRRSEKHVAWLRLTIAISLSSVVLFACGAFEAVAAFERL